jgi:hypothetical protein
VSNKPVLCQGTTLVVPKKGQNNWALQAAEKLSFVTGHDFSRAINAANSMRALAPEGCFSGNSPPFSFFPQPV